MTYTLTYNHGDRVIVVDSQGNHVVRGVIAGRHESRHGAMYDVQPDGHLSMSGRVVGVLESNIRPMGKPVLVMARRQKVRCNETV